MRKNNVLKRIAVMSLAVIMGIQTMPISAYADETIDVIGEVSEDNNEVVIPSTSDNDPGISLLSLSFGNNNWGTTCPDGTHKWNDECICTVCGMKCPHEDSDREIIRNDENTHVIFCNNCANTVYEAHQWDDTGTCVSCGETCYHLNTNSVANDKITHKTVCNDCGLLVSEKDAYQWENGACFKCGEECPHTNTNSIANDKNTHETVCEDCDEILVSEEAHQKNSAGICTVCGYCPHTNTEIQAIYPYAGQHKVYCNDCNTVVRTEDCDLQIVNYSRACLKCYNSLSIPLVTIDYTTENAVFPSAQAQADGYIDISNLITNGQDVTAEKYAIGFESTDYSTNTEYIPKAVAFVELSTSTLLGYVKLEDLDSFSCDKIKNCSYAPNNYTSKIYFNIDVTKDYTGGIGVRLYGTEANKLTSVDAAGTHATASGSIADPNNITITFTPENQYWHVIGYTYYTTDDLSDGVYVKEGGTRVTLTNKNIQGNLYIKPVCAWYTSDSYPVTANTKTITLSSNLTDHATIVYASSFHNNEAYLAKNGKILVDSGESIKLYAFCDPGYSLKSLNSNNTDVKFTHTASGATGSGRSGIIYDFNSWKGGNANEGITSDFTLDGTFYNTDHAMGYGGYILRYNNQFIDYGDTSDAVTDKGTIELSKTEDIIPGEIITMTITPDAEYTQKAPNLYFYEDINCDGTQNHAIGSMVNLQTASTNLPHRMGNMTITACDKDKNTGVWTLSLKMGRASTSSTWNVNDMPESMDMAYKVKYFKSVETTKDVLIKPNTHGTAVVESKDMDNGQASIKVTADDGYFYAGYRYAYANTIDDVTEADWITGSTHDSMVPENPYAETVWFDITQGKNCIIQPIFERNYATTVPYLKVMGLSKNIKVSDSVQIPGAPSGYTNWTNDCFVSTADNSTNQLKTFYSLFGQTYNVSLYYAGTDGCYSLSTSGTSYYDNTSNHLTKPGDTIYVLSKYKQDAFAEYGIQNSGNTLTINIPGLRTLDDVVTEGKVTNTTITPVRASKAKYFVGKYTIPDSWPASGNAEDRFSCVYPEYRAINYKINTKNVDHGTYTAKNDTPERYNWESAGYVDEYGRFGTHFSSNPGFHKTFDTLPDNLFTYMDTVKCVATPNTGWHVKAWVCMQDGVNKWDGMFDDETADYSTFSINMTNLGDAEIYPVFEGADPVNPTVVPTQTPTPTETPTETPAKTPEPEQKKDEDPEPTPIPEVTPEPTEAPKPAVIPVTPTKPDDPEPTETPEPTKAPEKPVKSAEPEVVITPPAVEPVELEDNISKVVPAVLSVTGTGVGGLAILILLKRRKRKFHGIFADAEIPGTKEKYGNTVLNVLDLMTKVNDKEINIAEYEDMLNNSDTYTYFPADTKITLITEDAEYSFDANEKKLFTELLNITGDVSIIFRSEEKNIELQYEMTL